MSTYYCGVGGNNSNNGTSYALRKLTLNGCEDIPVVAGDTIYVSPGVYREVLTCDVSGSSGSPITYIADVDGSHTDGVGGTVRVTGSDDDTTVTRANCITATSKNYRTFRGFAFDTTTSHLITLITSCGNWIVEDCYFGPSAASTHGFQAAGTGTTNTIRRCFFLPPGAGSGVFFTHTSVVDNSAHLVENCIFCGNGNSNGTVQSVRVGGFTVKNCSFVGVQTSVRVVTAITVGQTITVNNCVLYGGGTGFSATATGEITEDYNTIYGITTPRTNTNTGSNSVAYPALLQPPVQLAGFNYPWSAFALSQWSAVRRLAGTSMSSDGFYGITRPATDAKKSWGATQFVDTNREVTTVRTGASSLKLAEAGRFQMFVPTTNVSTTFSVYVQWEADYTGTKPQMVIKQPGQSDTTVVATGSSGSWELLTTTLTPAASPAYCIAELVSNNTASATNFDVFFDDFVVS